MCYVKIKIVLRQDKNINKNVLIIELQYSIFRSFDSLFI